MKVITEHAELEIDVVELAHFQITTPEKLKAFMEVLALTKKKPAGFTPPEKEKEGTQ